jgi:hypothetical protein
MFDEKFTSPILEGHGVIFPPLHEKVKYENESSLLTFEL